MASRTAYEFIVDMNKTRAEFVESRRESAKYKKELDDVKRKLDQLEKSERSAAVAVDKTNQVVSRGSRTMRIRSDDLVKGARITGGFNNATFQMSNAVQDATIAFGQMGFNLQAVGFAMRGASNNVGALLSGLGPMAAIGGTVAISLLNLASGMFRGARGAKEMTEETEKLVTALEKQEGAMRDVERIRKERVKSEEDLQKAGRTQAQQEEQQKRVAAGRDPLARALARGEFEGDLRVRADELTRRATVAEQGELDQIRKEARGREQRGPSIMDRILFGHAIAATTFQNLLGGFGETRPQPLPKAQDFFRIRAAGRAQEGIPQERVTQLHQQIIGERRKAETRARIEQAEMIDQGIVPGMGPHRVHKEAAEAFAKEQQKEQEKKAKTQIDIERDRETIRLRQEMQEWRRDLTAARQGQVGPALGNILPFPTGISEIGKGPFRDTIIDIMQALIENNQAQIQKSQSTEQIEKLNEREVENQ